MADYSQGRLSARPNTTVPTEAAPPARGLQPLGTGARRDGLVYIPSSYQHSQPAPLCIMMHGAGGNAKGAFFPPLRECAEKVTLCACRYAAQTFDFVTASMELFDSAVMLCDLCQNTVITSLQSHGAINMATAAKDD